MSEAAPLALMPPYAPVAWCPGSAGPFVRMLGLTAGLGPWPHRELKASSPPLCSIIRNPRPAPVLNMILGVQPFRQLKRGEADQRVGSAREHLVVTVRTNDFERNFSASIGILRFGALRTAREQ